MIGIIKNAPVCGRALEVFRIYSMKGLFTKNSHFGRAQTSPGHAIYNDMSPLREMGHYDTLTRQSKIDTSQYETNCL